jgi:hypothetical protein
MVIYGNEEQMEKGKPVQYWKGCGEMRNRRRTV